MDLRPRRWVFSGQDLEKVTSRRQHPVKFPRRREGEEGEQKIGAFVKEGHVGGGGGEPGDGLVAPGGAAHGLLGDVQPQELGLGQGFAEGI